MLETLGKTKTWARGVFYGWWVLGSSVATQFLTASFTLQSFGAYFAVMAPEFGWSKTAFSVAFGIQQAGGGLLGPVIGWLLGRFGSRQVIRVGIVIFAVGVALLSQIQTLAHFYGAVCVIALGASLSGFLPLNTIVVQWFRRWRSLALAFVQTGIAAGGLVVPIVAWALETYGWRASALGSSLLVLLVGVPLTYILRNTPEEMDLEPDGGLPPQNPDAGPLGRDFTAREAVRTRAFWFISFGHSLALGVVFAVLAHLVVFLTNDYGFSLTLAATMVTVMTSMSVAGQLIGGVLGDRFDKRFIATAAMFGHAGGLLMLTYGTGLPWAIAFAVTHGLAWGLRGPVMQSLRADYFGRTHFGQIMGLSSPIITVGMVGGPVLAGGFADLFGSYHVGFTVLASLAALGSVFFMLATPPKRSESSTSELAE